MTRAPAERFSCDLAGCLDGKTPKKIGVALSGGGDSTALLTLIAEWACGQDVVIEAVTVDHGLRPGAAKEAAKASEQCHKIGVAHETLNWTGWTGNGNLQAAARRARLDLIGTWAAAKDIAVVALGHTMDDQAETFLMRLARGSGVDGLSAMAHVRRDDARQLRWIRPLLGWRRSELREILVARGQEWADDPSNDDTRFERVRIRQAFKELPNIGLSVERLAATATRMGSARRVLEVATCDLARHCATVTAVGDIELGANQFLDAPDDIRLRLLSHALKWVGGGYYRPRHQALETALRSVDCGRRHSLAGCFIATTKGSRLRISREPAAVYDKIAPPGELWDGRWIVTPPQKTHEYHVAALGEEGLSACSDWKSTGLPRASLLASPAAWHHDTLLGAPLANEARGWACRLQKGADHFIASILSH